MGERAISSGDAGSQPRERSRGMVGRNHGECARGPGPQHDRTCAASMVAHRALTDRRVRSCPPPPPTSRAAFSTIADFDAAVVAARRAAVTRVGGIRARPMGYAGQRPAPALVVIDLIAFVFPGAVPGSVKNFAGSVAGRSTGATGSMVPAGDAVPCPSKTMRPSLSGRALS